MKISIISLVDLDWENTSGREINHLLASKGVEYSCDLIKNGLDKTASMEFTIVMVVIGYYENK